MSGVVHPTWHGYVHTIEDASILISACRAAQDNETAVMMPVEGSSSSMGNSMPLRMISRRLAPKDRPSIHSGSVFVFEERSSGIHRWTDKLMWSPSRQIGNFFVYRQMNIRVPRGTSVKHVQATNAASLANIALPDAETIFAERPYVGSLTSSPLYPRDGLVKKTLVLGTYHVISYFALDDVQSGALCTPSTSCDFSHVNIDDDLWPFGQTGSSRSMSGPPLPMAPLRNRHAWSAGGSADSPEDEKETYITRPIDLQAIDKFRSASVPTVHSDLRDMSGTSLATMPAHMRLDIASLPSHTITGQRGSWSSLSSSASRSSPLAFSPHMLPVDCVGARHYSLGPQSEYGNASGMVGNVSWPSSYSSSYSPLETGQLNAAKPPAYFPSHTIYDPPSAKPIDLPQSQNLQVNSLGLHSASAPTPQYVPMYHSNDNAVLAHSGVTSHVPGENWTWPYEKSSSAGFPHFQHHGGSTWVSTVPQHGSLDETRTGFRDYHG